MSSITSFETLWADANQQYLSSVDRVPAENDLIKGLRNIDDLQTQLDQDCVKFASFREKHQPLIGRLKGTVRPLVTLCEFTSASLSASPLAPASAVLGAVLFIVKAANGVSEAYDFIEQLFDKLEDFTIRLEQYLGTDIPEHLKSKLVQILACLLKILSQSEKAVKDKRWKKYAAALFLGQDEVFKHAFDTLTGLFEGEQQLVNALNFARNQKIEGRISELQQRNAELLQVSRRVDSSVETEFDRRRRAEILQWISPTDFGAQHADHLERRDKSSGLWFLQHSIFQAWVFGSNRTIFCPGMPGAGKTTMAATVIEHLRQMIDSKLRVVLYVYCDYNNRASQTAKRLLAPILRQMLQARKRVPDSLAAIYGREHKRVEGLTLDETVSELDGLISSSDRTYLILDALDGCQNDDRARTELLHNVRKLQNNPNLHLLVTSRFIPEIADHFVDCLRLEVRASDDDVRRYAQAQLADAPPCLRGKDSMKQLVSDSVAEAADGMFLLAKLHVQWIQGMISPKEIYKALAAMKRISTRGADPFRVYEQAYAHTIQRIDGQGPGHRDLAKRTLGWITYAKETLQVDELRLALAVEEDEDAIDEDNLSVPEQIVSVCAGLVTIDHESKTIRLVHYTTQEYLERLRDDWLPTAERDITMTLTRHLTFPCFIGEDPWDYEEFMRKKEQHALFLYACRYWGTYMKKTRLVPRLTSALLNDHNMRKLIVRLGTADTHFPWESSRTQPLHLIVRLGLFEVMQQYLDQNALSKDEINMEDEVELTPLMVAAWNGDKDIVHLLLSKGADCHHTNFYHANDLSYACKGKQPAIIELLLSLQVNPNVGRSRSTPLCHATKSGDASLVNILLDNGADVNYKGQVPYHDIRVPEHALNTAARSNNKDAIVVLLGRGGDQDFKTGSGCWPLQEAAGAGHEDLVRLLLAKGADVNLLQQVRCPDRSGGMMCALHGACAKGHESIVQVLIDAGADDNLAWGDTTSLWCAVIESESVQITRLLLENGAMPDETTLELAKTESDQPAARLPIAHAVAAGQLGHVG